MPKRNVMSFNILIRGFVQIGDLGRECKVFDEMDERNMASWNMMIIGLTQFELNHKALSLFTEMYGLSLGYLAGAFTLGSVLRECGNLKDLNKERQLINLFGFLGLTPTGYMALVSELMKWMGEIKPKLKSTVVAVFIASEASSSIPGVVWIYSGVLRTMVFANTVKVMEDVTTILTGAELECFYYHSDSSLEEHIKNLLDFQQEGGVFVCTDVQHVVLTFQMFHMLFRTGLECFCYHSESSLEERTKNLLDFQQEGGVFVCTDAAAHGIDILNVSHVIQSTTDHDLTEVILKNDTGSRHITKLSAGANAITDVVINAARRCHRRDTRRVRHDRVVSQEFEDCKSEDNGIFSVSKTSTSSWMSTIRRGIERGFNGLTGLIRKLLLVPSLSSSLGKDSGSSRNKILDPEESFLQFWKKIFVLACMIPVAIDPLFLDIHIIDNKRKCIDLDRTLRIPISILRSVTDLFCVYHIILQFRTGFIAPSSRVFGRGELIDDPSLIAKRYFSSYLIIDILAVLPLPQIMIFIITPNINRPITLVTKEQLDIVILAK
ncbi:putative cyclic nucleotide-gated ion channel 1-like isoform X2 [Capsicum annuum]|nr:putative cyclic nucleotide-gated ion channel 1-like isoform X2 [Capsicum annuum]